MYSPGTASAAVTSGTGVGPGAADSGTVALAAGRCAPAITAPEAPGPRQVTASA